MIITTSDLSNLVITLQIDKSKNCHQYSFWNRKYKFSMNRWNRIDKYL